MRLVYLAVGCLPILGQTQPVSHVTKAPGEKVTLDIFADSQPKGAPVALKWEVVFPAQLIEIDSEAAPEIGSAATNSGKSLECTARSQHAFACNVAGGKNPIADGPIATLHFRVRATAEARSIAIRIENAEATAADSKKWTLDDTEAIIIIIRPDR
jgi:hypothetical protein